jgi:S1-C subfamily serine protease
VKQLVLIILLLVTFLITGCSATRHKPSSLPTQQTPPKSIVDRLQRSVVSVMKYSGVIGGTGVVIKVNKKKNTLTIITAAHVIRAISDPTEQYCFGRILLSTIPPIGSPLIWCSKTHTVVAINNRTDLAIIIAVVDPNLLSSSISPLSVEIGVPARKGDNPWIIANQSGLQYVTIRRRIALVPYLTSNQSFIYLLDGSIEPGASGGGVFDDRGKLIGIIRGYLHKSIFNLPLATGVIVIHTDDIKAIISTLRIQNASTPKP